VFQDGVSYEVTRILQNNVTGGTGGNAQIGYPVAGKTGTTDDFRDAWFVGYTPKYSTAVWVGYPNADGTTRFMTSVHGIAVAGGTFPASIWGDFMRVVVERDGGSESFPLPDDPMTWSPFTSDFTRSAAAQAASAKAASSAASTEETESEGTTSVQRPSPSTSQAPPPTPAPPVTTVTPTPPAAPSPTPPAPATPPPAPPTTPTPPPPTTP
jgi:penicillin-binding protein 1A